MFYLSGSAVFTLKLAVEQQLIARNPADGCALPKAERKEMQTLPVEQLTSFLREAKDSTNKIPLLHSTMSVISPSGN